LLFYWEKLKKNFLFFTFEIFIGKFSRDKFSDFSWKTFSMISTFSTHKLTQLTSIANKQFSEKLFLFSSQNFSHNFPIAMNASLKMKCLSTTVKIEKLSPLFFLFKLEWGTRKRNKNYKFSLLMTISRFLYFMKKSNNIFISSKIHHISSFY
jgi:hypothetical protein